MKIGPHCYNKYSRDSHLEPKEVIEQAIKLNLDGVCFAEHHSTMPFWPIERIRIPEGFRVFRDVKISTDRGHLLVFRLRDDSWNIWCSHNYLNAVRVIENIHRLGGICVLVHPFREWDSFGDHIFKMDGLDAMETHNGLNLADMNEKAIQVSRLRNLPSIGGSDCHKTDQVGRAFTKLENHVHTVENLVEEIKMGNCGGMVL